MRADGQLNEGDIVRTAKRGRYRVMRKLGEGGFGAVYDVEHIPSTSRYAMKVEFGKANVLKMEVDVLRELDRSGGRHFCNLFDRGASGGSRFIVMTLVGQCLGDLRRVCTNSHFSTGTAICVGVQCLEAVQDLHSVGYLHRDLKPGNLSIGREQSGEQRKIYVLDFGMCRRFVNDRGEVRTPRSAAGFRGTVRYAPLNCHRERDLGRADDLETWFYMLVEFTCGLLPWRHVGTKDEVAIEKRKARFGDGRAELLRGCPRLFGHLFDYITDLQYWEQPDYEFMYRLLRLVLSQRGIDEAEPYDWERAAPVLNANV